jgi:hypothetical protein
MHTYFLFEIVNRQVDVDVLVRISNAIHMSTHENIFEKLFGEQENFEHFTENDDISSMTSFVLNSNIILVEDSSNFAIVRASINTSILDIELDCKHAVLSSYDNNNNQSFVE